jgi:Rieske Fe-S protein
MAADRRGFFKTLTVIIGGAIGAVLAVPALGYALFPVRRKTVQGGTGTPVPIAGIEEIPADRPQRFPVVADRQSDAWSAARRVPLGSCWLRKLPDGNVLALTATCPHLGCSVDYDAEAKEYRCPCHTSAFDLDGKRKSGPAKRGMDSLEATVEEGVVKVTFRRFKPDVADKVEG